MRFLAAKLLTEISPGPIVEPETSNGIYEICTVNGIMHCLDALSSRADSPRTSAATEVEDEDCKLRTFQGVVRHGQIFVELT